MLLHERTVFWERNWLFDAVEVALIPMMAVAPVVAVVRFRIVLPTIEYPPPEIDMPTTLKAPVPVLDALATRLLL